ncbi:Domain of unknown function DUF4781, partial [Cinara cedri]
MSEEEFLKGRQLITHLELIQYKFFNGRQEWTTIEYKDLKLYIAFIMYGSPSVEDDDDNLEEPDDIFNHYETEEKRYILDVYKTVVDNIVKSKKPIEVGITFTHSTCKKKCEVCWNFPANNIHQWYLFRIKTVDGAAYIDLNNKRTYANWTDYLENNNLPKGIMFYPPSGYYEESKCLEHTLTPASKIISKTLKKIDTVGNVVNVVSNVCMAGGIAFPIFAPLLIPSTIISIISNTFTVTRSVEKIVDLKKHNEKWLGTEHLTNLTISLLSTVTTIGSGIKLMSGLKSSKMLFSRLGSATIKTFTTINSGICILECTLEVMRLSMKIKNKKKLTIKDFMFL